MSENSTVSLTDLVKETGDKFSKSLTDLRAEFDAAQAAGTAEAGDVRAKLEKFEKDFADRAADVSKLQAAIEDDAKQREDLEAKVEELARRGVNVDGADDPEMLDARISLTQARQEMGGGQAKRIHGDEFDSELASADDVKALDAAFSRYLTSNGGKEFSSLEGRIPEHTFEVGSGVFAPSYGILIPPLMTNRIMRELYTYGSLRGLAMLRTGVPGDSVKIMRATGKTTVRVGTEVTDWSAGDLPKMYPTEYSVVDWSSTVSIHRNTLEDASFNIRNFLRQEATMALGESEANFHINGDGIQKPRGILSLEKSDVGISGNLGDATFGTLKAINTGANGAVSHATATNASGTFNPAIAAVNGLHSRYRKNATWIMARSSYAAFAMVKDGDGRYVMPMSEQLVREGGGLSLVQRPVRINDHMPALANNAYFALVGDWMQAFEIADKSASMFALVDIYSDKPNVEITLSRRSGASVADTRAIRALKAAA